MASVKLAYANAVSLTLTSFNSLTTSATAGWQSDAQDNTSNLYLDYLVQVKLAAVNTAPANSKALFLYAFGLADTATSDYTGTGSAVPSGSVGTLTFSDVTANDLPCPLLGILPYPTQNNVINSSLFSVARCFGGSIPPKFSIGAINLTGMTIAASGNAIKITPVYATIV